MYASVVVGTDGSDTATSAVRQAIELAALVGARLHVVTVYKPTAPSTVPADLAAESGPAGHAESVLKDMASQARAAGVDVVTHAETGDPADAIVTVAAREAADLIVVGNKGMHGARRVLGSVPNSVAHKAPCSTLIVETT